MAISWGHNRKMRLLDGRKERGRKEARKDRKGRKEIIRRKEKKRRR